MSQMQKKDRNEIYDWLRGLAAIAVVLGHYRKKTSPTNFRSGLNKQKSAGAKFHTGAFLMQQLQKQLRKLILAGLHP